MSIPNGADGYGLGPDEGEALWFNGGLELLKATADLTSGRFAAVELRARQGFASPLHIHRASDRRCRPRIEAVRPGAPRAA
jgi:hypothetical protein